MLLVAGHVNHDLIHRECGSYHEVDLESIFRPCTGFAGTVFANETFPGLVQRGVHAPCRRGRPRSAALFLPQDLAALPSRPTRRRADPVQLKRIEPLAADDLRAAVRLLRPGQRPIILAGGGAVWSDAGAALQGDWPSVSIVRSSRR